MRVRLLDELPTTVIRMAANSAARATSYPWTNTLVIGAASARIVATANNRLRHHRYCHRLSQYRRHWHHRHRPDHQSLDPIHRDQ